MSSVLHLVSQAQGDAELEQESGFGRLFDAIHTTIWEPARTRGLADAGQQLADLADHLAIPLDAAQMARGSEHAAEQTIARLTEVGDRVRQFRSSAAPWRRRLEEGMQSASVDLEHDLTNRLRSLSRMIEERVDGDDPGDGLVFEAWVHKRTIEEVVAHYRLIADRANALADEIGQQFATLDPHAVFEVDVSVPDDLLATVHVNRQQRLLKDGVARRIVPTGDGYRSGLFVTSVVGAVNALAVDPLARVALRRIDGPTRAQRRPRPTSNRARPGVGAPRNEVPRRDRVDRARGLRPHHPEDRARHRRALRGAGRAGRAHAAARDGVRHAGPQRPAPDAGVHGAPMTGRRSARSSRSLSVSLRVPRSRHDAMPDRLLASVRQLLDVAEPVLGERSARIVELRERLDGPLRVAIAGKVKAGKSTLLNTLVGERIAPTDASECTRVVTRYRNSPPWMCRCGVSGRPRCWPCSPGCSSSPACS